MMKLGEQYAKGGNTKLLQINDWEDLKVFSENPIASQKVKRQGAKSKNVETPQYRQPFSRIMSLFLFVLRNRILSRNLLTKHFILKTYQIH